MVIYVETDKLCESVSIIWPRRGGENFRVCNGEIHARNTVSPVLDDSDIRTVLSSVVNNAIMYGQAKQKVGSGYSVAAGALSAVSNDCKNVEVIVSYDGDLVDRGVQKVCGK